MKSHVKIFIWNLHCTSCFWCRPPRADGSGIESETANVNSVPVVGSSTDALSQENSPRCKYTNTSAMIFTFKRSTKDLVGVFFLSRPAELPHTDEGAPASSDTEFQTVEEGAAAEDGEPSAAELRRRRLRKLASSSSTPPPGNWSTYSDSLFSGPTGIVSLLLVASLCCNSVIRWKRKFDFELWWVWEFGFVLASFVVNDGFACALVCLIRFSSV